jgi:hypothetical protein
MSSVTSMIDLQALPRAYNYPGTFVVEDNSLTPIYLELWFDQAVVTHYNKLIIILPSWAKKLSFIKICANHICLFYHSSFYL